MNEPSGPSDVLFTAIVVLLAASYVTAVQAALLGNLLVFRALKRSSS